MKVKSSAKWKSIPLAHSFFTAGMDQAVCGGIEELTDYTLVLKGSKSGKVRKKNLSAPAMKSDEEVAAQKRKNESTEEASTISKKAKKVTDGKDKKKKKKQGVEGIEKQKHKKAVKEGAVKQVKKNGFKIIDVVEEESDFVTLSRSQVTEEKKKKKKKKSGKNKPAINLEAFNKLPTTAIEAEPDARDEKEANEPDKLIGKESLKKKKEKKSKAAVKDTQPVEELPEAAAIVEDIITEASDEVSEWKELFVCDEILKALEEKGFRSPTPIQRLTLAASLKGKMDIVGAAETGSGKTLAFGIPIIQGIIEDREYEKKHPLPDSKSEEPEDEDASEEVMDLDNDGIGCVGVVDNVEFDFDSEEAGVALPAAASQRVLGDKLRALVLTPTRELAMQIYSHLTAVAKYTGVGVAVVVGGLSVEKQLRLLKRSPAIVVATPGRLWDLVQEGNPHLSMLSQLRYLAIDETDRMVEKGHFEELQKLLEMVNASRKDPNLVPLNSRERQTFIMSATLSLVHKPPQHVKKQKTKSSEEKLGELMEMVGVRERRKVVDITRKAGTAENLSESVIHCALTDKDFFLYYVIKSHPGRTVVFCNSIDCVRRLSNLFSLMDVSPLPLHAQLHQKQRLKNLDRFTASPTGLLIATDVAARGLDIPDIQHVVHYQVPRTSEGYVHRSGRTARATRSGLSLLLVEPGEQRNFQKLQMTLARVGEKDVSIPTFPVDSSRLGAVKERVTAARRLDKMLLANRKAAVSENWRSRAAEEAELILSDAEDSEEEFYQGRLQGKQGSGLTSKQGVSVARAALQQLLNTPLDQAVYGGSYPTMGGLLPTEVLSQRTETAVECLASNLKHTENLLKGKKRPSHTKKFKGFKKKKPNTAKSA